MNPTDYTGAFADLANPMQSFMQGLQGGATIRTLETQQQQAALAQRKGEHELQVQQQMQQDFASLGANPSTQDIIRMAAKYPHLSEHSKRIFEMMDPKEKQARLTAALPAYYAMEGGNYDVAAKHLREQAQAYRNSDRPQEAAAIEAKAELIETNPALAKISAGWLLADAIGPDKLIETIGGLQLQPAAVREATAKADKEEADVVTKNLGIVGQTIGSLHGKAVKPQQIVAAFKSLGHKGVIPKEDVDEYIAGIPTDPKALPEYLDQFRMLGMKPDEQMGYIKPDANTVANNNTSRANNAASNRTQMAIQDRIDARADASGSAEPTLDQNTLTMMAQQYLSGDKSVLQNLGRGNQGATNLVALRREITSQAMAKGMTGPQIAAAMADYSGQVAGLRTSGNISARIENAAAEAAELAPLAVEAGRNVSRSGYLPFGKAQVMFDTQTNNPALNKFATANIGLATAYANAMARGQKATVSDMHEARELLTTAKSQPAYEAIVEQMLLEIKAAQRAPQTVRKHLREEISGGGSGGRHNAAPAGGHPSDINALINKYGSK